MVVGTGGVGGYFGGLLAKKYQDIIFLARGSHLKAIQDKGLIVESYKGNFAVKVKATSDPKIIDPPDLILFCVKSFDTLKVAAEIKSFLKKDTAIISLQNGIDNVEKLEKIFGKGRVLGGVVYIFSMIKKPGIIHHSAGGRIVFGELDGKVSFWTKEILKIFQDADIHCSISGSIFKDLWEKLVWNSFFNAFTAITRKTVREVMEDNDSVELARLGMKEILEVARAESVLLDEKAIDKALELSQNVGHDKTSMLRDLEKGRPLELEALNGEVVRRGIKYGIPVPVNQTLYTILKLMSAPDSFFKD